MTMLRSLLPSSRAARRLRPSATATARSVIGKNAGFATQSGNDAKPPHLPAYLHLADGSTHVGKSFGKHAPVSGEVVFSTGMVGYTEGLTDPSYAGQILTLTTPMVGNYGVPDRTIIDEHGLPKYFESHKIHATGLLVQDYSHHYSHWNAASSL